MPTGVYKRTEEKHFKGKFKKGQIAWNKGMKMSDKICLAMSKGQKGKKYGPMPDEQKKKISLYRKGRPRPEIQGENCYNWKGGITPINKAIRNSIEYEEWRTKVFERDLYTCQHCGQIGGYLEADHIKPFAYYPDLRFTIGNGRTLCRPCHMKTPTHGRRKDMFK